MILVILFWFYVLLVIIKCILDGLVLNWMYENMMFGIQVFGEGLFGKFICVGEILGFYLFIFGGSGVIFVMFMVCWFCDIVSGVDIYFVYFVCFFDDLIYVVELDYFLWCYCNFRIMFVVSCFGEGWSGLIGYIFCELLFEIVFDFYVCYVYLCGFVFFMVVVKEMLEQFGYNMDNFWQESFGGVLVLVKFVLVDVGMVWIVFFGVGLEIDCVIFDIVFDIVFKVGVDIVYFCWVG